MASRLRGVIDLRRAWVQELRNTGKVVVKHVDGDKNMADVFTKCMPAYIFNLRLRAIRGDQARRHMAKFIARIHTQ